MEDETPTTSNSEPAAAPDKPKPGRPAKGVNVKNLTARPVTLIANGDRQTIMPTETKELDKAFMAEVRKNRAAMSFFEAEELIEV